jgi:PEP-CTERM motif
MTSVSSHASKSQAGASLEQRLDAYSAQAAAQSKSGGPSWPRYAAAAGAGLALATATGAAIIHTSGPVTVNVPASGGFSGAINTAPINFGGGAGTKLNLHAGAFSNSFGSRTRGVAPYGIAGGGVLTNGNGTAQRLNSGKRISSGAGPFGNLGRVNGHRSTSFGGSSNFGQWGFSTTGFAGVRFTVGGQTHYGWIRLEVSTQDGVNPSALTALDWAWNTVANQRILAGQVNTVPEPTSLALMLLASGSAGVLAWRRRRKAG